MNAEAQRQQALLAAILQRAEHLTGLAKRPAGVPRGLEAYRANAGASAERALATAFPTVHALVGDDSFASLARAFWHACPPECGDLAMFGAGLPGFIAQSEQLADVPYLADVARVDWSLAEAERAPDVDAEPATLALLTETDPAELLLALMPGTVVIASDYPVASLWKAHQANDEADAARDQVRASLESGEGECAVVWRQGWRGQVIAVDAATARWMQSLLREEPLSSALLAAGDGFDVEAWLVQSLQQQWLRGARKKSLPHTT
ncbi:MAG: DNA-binding domain-containing protein [Rhizobacter sp.]